VFSIDPGVGRVTTADPFVSGFGDSNRQNRKSQLQDLLLAGFQALQGDGDGSFTQEVHHRLIGGLRSFQQARDGVR
jgi:hypothetical protein